MLHTLKTSKFKELKLLLPSLILMAFYFSEFVSKFLKYSYRDFTRFSAVIKLIVEISLVYYIVTYKKSCQKTFFKIIILFAGLYTLGQLLLQSENLLSRYILNLYSLNSYLFIFILYFALKPEDNRCENILTKQLGYLDIAIKSIFICNAVAIFTGTIFNIDVFKTYLGISDRFGYNGLFLHASHSSYIYMILVMYFFQNFLKKKDRNSLIFLISSVIVSFFVGTKTIFLFNALFLLYLTLKWLKFRVAIVTITALIILTISLIPFIEEFSKNYFRVLYDVYTEDGLITMIFSFRDISITESFIPYITQYWTFFNYLVGGAEFNYRRTEIEIIDVFWFWGMLGGVLYIGIFYKYFLRVFFKNREMMFPIIFLLVCALLSGSFFTNVPILSYFIVLYYATSFNFGDNRT
jgi:hypothetical protein